MILQMIEAHKKIHLITFYGIPFYTFYTQTHILYDFLRLNSLRTNLSIRANTTTFGVIPYDSFIYLFISRSRSLI